MKLILLVLFLSMCGCASKRHVTFADVLGLDVSASSCINCGKVVKPNSRGCIGCNTESKWEIIEEN